MGIHYGKADFINYGKPSLLLDFAREKSLVDRISRNNLITFERASIGTYVGADGLIKTAAADEARFDHDPETGESLGLLIEEQRTNLISRSQELDNNSDWTKTTGTTIVANATTAPDGTLTADRVVYDGTGSSGSYRVYFGSNPGTSGVIYNTSIWLKSDTPITVRLSGNGSGAAGNLVTCNLTTQWQRFSTVGTGANGSSFLQIVIYSDSGDNSSISFYAWGAQLEAGSFPTSYIPTSGSTVTREADSASIVNSDIYNTDTFTITNEPFGVSAGTSTLSLVGPTVKKTAVYSSNLPQASINSLVRKTDDFWRWRVLGSSFGLPLFTTDGQVTVDWGDGTVETLTTSDHTFTNGGGYHEIGFRLDSGTSFRPQIYNDANHRTKVVALGPAPESMVLHGERSFWGCSNLESFDATVDATASLNRAWQDCNSLTSFPLIDTSAVSDFSVTWLNCSSLTSFPSIDTSSGTDFSYAWFGCTGLTSFPLIDTSSGTNFSNAWYNCSSLTSLPLLDTSSGTLFNGAWYNNNSLTSFPLIDTSSGTNFSYSWRSNNSLTSFPLLDTSSGTNFSFAWLNCSSITSFPANFFDSWTGTPADNCFEGAWDNCSSLTATSVENILNSIDTSGQSAPASGVDITIDYNAGSGTPSVSTAVTNLKSRGWTITLNGVAQ